MKTLEWLVLGGLAALGLTAISVGCMPQEDGEDEVSGSASHLEVVDPLDGAYIKQGGTPVFFVFKKATDAKSKSSFFGEIDVDGQGQRASGTAVVAQDNLGTTLTLTEKGTSARDIPDAGDPDAAPADLQAADTRQLVDQAFSGTVHYLKIGKNDTILVRGDANGKTAQYKKFKTWCATADDCSPDVQSTGLDCTGSDLICTSKNICACR
jgi:hypothetical protein